MRRQKLKKPEKLLKAELQYIYNYTCRLYREGYIDEAINLSKNLVKLAFKYKLGSYAFKLVCRKCYVPVIPGLTVTYRVKRRGGKSYILTRCINCGYTRKKVFKHKGVEKRARKK